MFRTNGIYRSTLTRALGLGLGLMYMVLLAQAAATPQGTITTVAGNGGHIYSGDGGPALNASMRYPNSVAMDAAGNLYIADIYNQRVRRVDAATGVITTVAGNGSQGYAGDGGPAVDASMYYPADVALDAAGNLYIADHFNHRVRKVDAATGVITTIAGNGSTSYPGDGALATDVGLIYPYDVALDAVGNLYIVEGFNVRKVNTSGIITTVAGNGLGGYSGDGGLATNARMSPRRMALDALGSLYIADRGNERIRKVYAASGCIATVAGSGTRGYSGDGGAATSADLRSPESVAVDDAGNLYIADQDNQRIRKVDAATGVITTIAGNGVGGFSGDGGLATAASFSAPSDVALDAAGNIYITDFYNGRVRKVTALPDSDGGGAPYDTDPCLPDDVSAPVITPSIAGTLGSEGWYRGAVSVSWNVTDPESGIASSSGCETSSLTADAGGVLLTCSAVNGVGFSYSYSVIIKIDQTAPGIGATRTPAANANGWNHTNVAVTFSCSDAMSGVGTLSPEFAVLSAESANQSVVGLCTDVAGNSASTVVSGISIDKTPPVTANVTVSPNPVAVQTGVTLEASLSDSGSGLEAAEYSVNASPPLLLSAASGAAAVVNGAVPPFTAAGVYSLCVHARDLAGNVGADDCALLPVYDPSGGFVTGGGWINSPAGAYSADPTLTGKATFGFVSRYQPGAAMPSGETQFQFRVGNLNFKSTAYDWLVIAGSRAQYKGVGTINGAGSYNFLLTAIDGETPGGGGADRFRIKIWYGGVIYDNEQGGGDGDDPTTALGGGSIVIHKNESDFH